MAQIDKTTQSNKHLSNFRTTWSSFQETVFAEADKVANTVAE